MTTEFIKDFTEKTKESFAPIAKFNELMSASIQDLFHAQVAASQRYTEMTLEQVKAASEIRDVESFQTFFQKQIGAFEALNEQVMSDLKSMADAGIKFRQDLEAIINPAEQDEPKPAAKKASTKAAAKPATNASA